MRLQKPNRNEAKRPAQGLAYCPSCDRQLVAEDRKCRVCSNRYQGTRKRRYKKDPPAVSD